MNQFNAPEGQPAQSDPQMQPAEPQAYIHSDVDTTMARPVETAVPLQPVGGARSHRFRWAIAGAVVLTVALVTAAGAFVLSGAAGTKSLTASAAPKSTAMFMELRTDLPGDQHQKLADFMTHFPGFADRAQFDSALDEVFNRITNSVSPDLAYTSAFKPWMEGEVSIVVLPGSGTGQTTMGSMMLGGGMSAEDAAVIVALKDRSAAQTWISGELASMHVTTTSATYAGETLYSLSGAQGSYALTNADLIVGTTTAVKASLDTKTAGSLADDANYQAAMKSLSGDSLARFYVNPNGLIKPLLSSTSGMGMNLTGTTAKLPAWIAGSARAESDRLVVEMTSPTTTSGSGNHASVLAGSLPADTVALFEAHSVGSSLSKAIDSFKAAAPSLGVNASQLTQVQQVLALVGGVDWIGDTAVAVTDANGTVGGGIVVQATDAATAKSKVATLSTLLAFGGASLGVKTITETYKGQSITIVTIPQTTNSLGGGMSLTTDPVQIGITVKDNLIVAGYKDAFAKDVIDTTSSNALSAQSDYNAVTNAVGASNAGSFYVNVPALEDQIGKMAVSSSIWTTNYKPYFDHVGGIGYASIDGSTSTVRIVLMAR